MKKFIVTFGAGHLGGFGLHWHLEVVAPDELSARQIICKDEVFGRKWSMIYEVDEYLPSNNGDKWPPTKPLGQLYTDGITWATNRPEGWS